jgi:hypothetical protein
VLFFIAGVITPVQQATARTQCKNNLKSIGLTLRNYHDTCGRFPLATVSKDADPFDGPHRQGAD